MDKATIDLRVQGALLGTAYAAAEIINNMIYNRQAAEEGHDRPEFTLPIGVGVKDVYPLMEQVSESECTAVSYGEGDYPYIGVAFKLKASDYKVWLLPGYPDQIGKQIVTLFSLAEAHGVPYELSYAFLAGILNLRQDQRDAIPGLIEKYLAVASKAE